MPTSGEERGKHAATVLREKSPEEDDPEKSPQKLSERVWELLSARFKNCSGVEGENKCSRRR